MNILDRIEQAKRIMEFAKEYETQPEVHMLLMSAAVAMVEERIGVLLSLAVLPILEATETAANQFLQSYKAKLN